MSMGAWEHGSVGAWERGDGESQSPVLPFSRSPAPHERSPYGKRWHIVLILILAASLPACGYYSFSSGTVSQHLETIAIPLASENTTSVVQGLSERLTELLTDRFVQQTNLSLESNENQADAVLNVSLTDYRTQQTAVQETATQVRITIEASARYYDQAKDTLLMEHRFNANAQYDPVAVQDVDAERSAAFAALEDLADDIFTSATSNW
jgi:hypothetical protein